MNTKDFDLEKFGLTMVPSMLILVGLYTLRQKTKKTQKADGDDISDTVISSMVGITISVIGFMFMAMMTGCKNGGGHNWLTVSILLMLMLSITWLMILKRLSSVSKKKIDENIKQIKNMCIIFSLLWFGLGYVISRNKTNPKALYLGMGAAGLSTMGILISKPWVTENGLFDAKSIALLGAGFTSLSLANSTV